MAVTVGVGVKVTVGDGSSVGVAESVAVLADRGEAVIADNGVEVAVPAGSGIFNIEAAIGGDPGAAWAGLVLLIVVSDEGRAMGLHLVPPEVT